MSSGSIRRRALLSTPVLVASLAVAEGARADGMKSCGKLNDEFLAKNPKTAMVVREVESDLMPEELRQVVTALREAPENPAGPDLSSAVTPLGGKRVCVTVRRWVLMTIYVAWKVNGWGAALASIPVGALGGIAPGVILAAIGIGYGEGAAALKSYIDRYDNWPRQVCVWAD